MQKNNFSRPFSNESFKRNPRKFGKQNQVRIFKKRKATKDVEGEEIQRLLAQYEQFEPKKVENFVGYPLSRKTQIGLKKGGYFTPSEIQRDSITLALKGCDILGAAKTGSGKTLAFLIPILEKLYQERWTKLDGVGALVITPTRELAYQIFEVLNVVGSYHDFSAGLIIGGKDLHFEKDRMDKCNIIICTPGRLLHHMDQNPLFDYSNLKLLVLDEADRILDLGFQKTMNSIIENLPPERQTLLFSATQTKSVKDLARLSLKDPEYVSVHENAKHSTPETLAQSYVVCDLHEKMDFLWSFIRNHRKQKILVFLSSCKQVKYTFEVFCRMRPGLSVLALYGTLHQLRRMAIYDEFCQKSTAVLLATDIAARGLDFPSVDWVVHLDCPEDVNTYIHRAGRTARYEKDGESLLVLLPSEERSMIEQLEGKKIPLQKIHVSQLKYTTVQRKMEALCARDVKLKESAQRAFVAYLKSVFLMKDKSVFVIRNLDIDAYARSLGLAVSPRVRFLQKHLRQLQAKGIETITSFRQEKHLDDKAPDEEEPRYNPASKVAYQFDTNKDDDSNDENDFLTVKRVIMPSEENSEDEEPDFEQQENRKMKVISKAAVAKKIIKKKLKVNKKTVFNEDGQEVENFPTEQKSELAQKLLKETEDAMESGLNIEVAKKIMEEEDKIDKRLFRQRVKALHKERKKRLRADRGEDEEGRRKRQRDSEESENEDPELAEFIDELPDPDKASNSSPMKKKKKKEDKKFKTRDHSEEEDEKKGSKKEKKTKKKSRLKDTMNLSMEADEELALHILTGGK